MYNVIGLVGFKGSGKDTVANILSERFGYKTVAFADSIKDCLASIFSWDRALLEGDTKESREWREQIDPWWANRLNLPHFTPRWAMTNFGTDLMRNQFNTDIWLHNTDRKVQDILDRKERVIVKDCRFPNEIEMVKGNGGITSRVLRGPAPAWERIALAANGGCAISIRVLDNLGVHQSEYALVGYPTDFTIDNNHGLDDLSEALGVMYG